MHVSGKYFVPVRGCKYPRNCLFREFYTSLEPRSVTGQSLPRTDASRPPVFVLGQYYGSGYFVREPHASCRHGVYRMTYRVGVSVRSIYSVDYFSKKNTNTRLRFDDSFIIHNNIMYNVYIRYVQRLLYKVIYSHFKQFFNSRDMYRVRVGLQSVFTRVRITTQSPICTRGTSGVSVI